MQKPSEFASARGFAQQVASKKPDAVFVLPTHDQVEAGGEIRQADARVDPSLQLSVMKPGEQRLISL